MKAVLGILVSLLVFSVASANASDMMQVNASRDLRVAVVDTAKRTNDRDALHKALGASLSAALSEQIGAQVVVKLSESYAERAADALNRGTVDAVLVFNDPMPQAMSHGGFKMLRAVSQMGVPARVFYLVTAERDPYLETRLASSFETALAAPKFQQVLTRAVAMRVTSTD